MLFLKAEKRNILGRKTKRLWKNNLIPAVVYGHDIKTQPISVPYLDFQKIYQAVGETGLINLIIDNAKPIQVLVHDVQYHPLTGKFHHIDFYRVKTGEKITLEIGLKFVGTAPAVKELGGIFFSPLNKLKVECLPQDLVHEIEVDISKLATFDDVIRVKDLVVPEGLKILESPDEVVCLVKAPRTEEELKSLEEKPVEKVEEVETVKKPSKEEEPSESKEE